MELFNPKEQVISLELTPYGKHLLSKGELRPAFYSFVDSDILYDAASAQFVETQNSASVRIKEQTPRTSVQSIFYGIETENGKSFDQIKCSIDKLQLYDLPIGTMGIDATKVPAWSLSVLKGQISSSLSYTSSVNFPIQKVPQINLIPIEYKTMVKVGTPPTEDLPLAKDQERQEIGTDSDISFFLKKFKDGSYVDIIEDTVVIQLDEINGIYEKENFDLEVFEVLTDARTGEEVLKQLFFVPPKTNIINNVLIPDLENEQEDITKNNVEHYFELLTDREINEEFLCELNWTPRVDILDLNPFPDCDAIRSRNRTIQNIYKKSISQEECK